MLRWIKRLQFMLMPRSKKEKLFISWLVDRSLETGLMPPPELLTDDMKEKFDRALKDRKDYESLFQTVPWPLDSNEDDSDEIFM